MDPIRHPPFRYVREYQTVEFTRVRVASGRSQTAVLNIPFRFIATGLICQAFNVNTAAPESYAALENPPILTLLRLHTSPLDDSQIPLRSAWGTARNPAMLPVPMPIEQGTTLQVECANILGKTGIVVGNQRIELWFSILGYQPSDEEFNALRERNAKYYQREYYTITAFQNTTIGSGETVTATVNVPNDLMGLKQLGQVFSNTAGSEVNGFIVAVEEPTIKSLLRIKSAELNTEQAAFRAIFGDAKFPYPLKPALMFKAGDTLAVKHTNLNATGAVSDLLAWTSHVGYIPKNNMVRAADVQRGRRQPEGYMPNKVDIK